MVSIVSLATGGATTAGLVTMVTGATSMMLGV